MCILEALSGGSGKVCQGRVLGKLSGGRQLPLMNGCGQRYTTISFATTKLPKPSEAYSCPDFGGTPLFATTAHKCAFAPPASRAMPEIVEVEMYEPILRPHKLVPHCAVLVWRSGVTGNPFPCTSSACRLVNQHCQGKRITKVKTEEGGGGPRTGQRDEIVFDGVDFAAFERALVGSRLVAMCRKGKYMWWQLDKRPWPTFHFGMTGAWLRDVETWVSGCCS